MKQIDVFKCIKCDQHKSGIDVGETCEFPYAKPPRLEVTCRDCAKIDACEVADLTPAQVDDARSRLKQAKTKYAKRVSELESEGLTTSDAQAVVDAEEMRRTKTKPAHTPGPWRVGDNGATVFGPKTDAPCPRTIATLTKQPMILNETRANAALIAAAPDLMDVAECVLRMAEAMRIERDAMPRSHEAPKSVDAIGVAIERAKQAIAKARGGAR